MGRTAKKAKKEEAPASAGLVDFDDYVSQFDSRNSHPSEKVEEIHEFSYDDSSIVDFDSYVDGFGHPDSVEDKKSKFVSLVSDLLGVPDEEAAAMYDASLKGHFKRAAQSSTLPDNYLCVPEGQPEKYLGKGKSGEIYAFLERVYPYREGAEPLTAPSLQELDPAALASFRGRRKKHAVPENLIGLTREGKDSKELSIIEKYQVDINSPNGIAEARRLMSAINNRLYQRER